MANYICSSKRIVLDYILIFTRFFTHNSLYLFIFIFFNQSLGDKNTYKQEFEELDSKPNVLCKGLNLIFKCPCFKFQVSSAKCLWKGLFYLSYLYLICHSVNKCCFRTLPSQKKKIHFKGVMN